MTTDLFVAVLSALLHVLPHLGLLLCLLLRPLLLGLLHRPTDALVLVAGLLLELGCQLLTDLLQVPLLLSVA